MLKLYFCNLISSCLNAQLEIKLGKLETKVGKLPVIVRYTCNFNSKLLRGKNMADFCWTVPKFQKLFSVGIHNCEKENKNLYVANEEMKATTVDFQWLTIWRTTRQEDY